MRDLFLSFILLAIGLQTLRAPAAGILGWTWLTLMTPQRLAWGFAIDTPFNLLIAAATFVSLIFSRERRWPPLNVLTLIWLAFIADITLTTSLSLAPEIAWERWSRTIKIMTLGLLIPTVITDKNRIHSLILIIAISISYFGIKGGAFTLLTGGDFHVFGPPDSELADNNNLALALCMTLPLLNYIRLQSCSRVSRVSATIAMMFDAVAVLGTYSRGGLVGLGIMGTYLIWKSKHRILVGALAGVAIVIASQYMPGVWVSRMHTIGQADEDASFKQRLDAWKVALNIVEARPLIGSGPGASERPRVYAQFSPPDSVYLERAEKMQVQPVIGAHAYHSIYFQVLGDNGFPGLFLFLGLLGITWIYLGQIRRSTAGKPEESWAFDLATMTQVSMVSYLVAGAALSMAYYDMPYLFMGIAIAMRNVVRDTPGEQTYRRPSALLHASAPSQS